MKYFFVFVLFVTVVFSAPLRLRRRRSVAQDATEHPVHSTTAVDLCNECKKVWNEIRPTAVCNLPEHNHHHALCDESCKNDPHTCEEAACGAAHYCITGDNHAHVMANVRLHDPAIADHMIRSRLEHLIGHHVGHDGLQYHPEHHGNTHGGTHSNGAHTIGGHTVGTGFHHADTGFHHPDTGANGAHAGTGADTTSTHHHVV